MVRSFTRIPGLRHEQHFGDHAFGQLGSLNGRGGNAGKMRKQFFVRVGESYPFAIIAVHCIEQLQHANGASITRAQRQGQNALGSISSQLIKSCIKLKWRSWIQCVGIGDIHAFAALTHPTRD